MRKLIIVVLALSVVLGFAFWKFLPLFQKPQQTGPITLTFWGLWDDDKQLADVIAAYEKQNPNIKINYVHQSLVNYRTRVQTQIQAGQGPDIFMLHNSWVSTFLKFNSISAAPDSVITPDEFSKTFYPVAKDSFVVNDKVYALPLSVDGLALYVNVDLLTALGLTPPTDWFSFVNSAGSLTVRDSTGVIKTAGVGMGASNNVDFWPDILGLLYVQQPGADLNSVDNSYGVQVLKFYTSFVTDPKHKAWDQTLQSSTTMFEQGNLAFYFAPSTQIPVIKAANPSLHFKVVPVPQLPGNSPAAWASFWAPAVSFSSPHQQEAWQF